MLDTAEILFAAAHIVFSFWPLFILSPLGAKKVRGPLLPKILTAWGIAAVLRLLMLFAPAPIPLMLIPEPLSTYLFLLTGIGLLALHVWHTKRQQRLFRQKTGGVNSVEDLLALSPAEFEAMVAALYQAAGHRARRTGTVGDHGVDVIVDAKNGEHWVVQCKRWRGNVGERIVREFYGVMQHEKAHRGVIVTTGRFTRPAQTWARGKPLALYDGEQFLRLWHKMQAAEKA